MATGVAAGLQGARESSASTRRRRANPTPALVVAAVVAAGIALPMVSRLMDDHQLVRGQNDVASHVGLIDKFAWDPLTLPAPHPLFHLVVGAGSALGLSRSLVAPLVLTAAAAAAAVVVGRWLMRSGVSPTASAAVAVAFLVAESPAVAVQWSTRIGADAYIPLHLWSGPTSLVLLPLAAYVFGAVADRASAPAAGAPAIGDPSTSTVETTPPSTTAVVLASIAAPLAKPSFTLVLLPGLGGWWLLRWWRGRPAPWSTVRWLGVAVVLPMALTMGAQMLAWRGMVDPRRAAGYALDPLVALTHIGAWSFKFWLILALPIALLAAVGRRAADDDGVVIAGFAVLAALVATALFADTGWRVDQFTLGHLLHAALLLLVLATIRRFLVELAAGRIGRRRATIAAAVASAFVLAGIGAWLVDAGLVGDPPYRAELPPSFEEVTS